MFHLSLFRNMFTPFLFSVLFLFTSHFFQLLTHFLVCWIFVLLIFFINFNQWNPHPFIFLKPGKGTPFGQSLPIWAIIGSTDVIPPPPPEEWTANNVPKPNLAGFRKTAPDGSSRLEAHVQQKDTLGLAIHSSCWKALHERGCLRLTQVVSREFKATSPPYSPPPTPQRSTCLRGMLSLANGPQTLKEADLTSLRQTWRVHWLSQSKTNGQCHAFAAPSPLGIDMEAPSQPMES